MTASWFSSALRRDFGSAIALTSDGTMSFPIVTHLMNDRPPFKVDTAYCIREPDGNWPCRRG